MDIVLDSCYIAVWSDAYSIGDQRIDKEHQKLFDIANGINRCTTPIQLTNILKELIKYTKFHFANEEYFMKSINFKKLNHHKILHRKIVDKLNHLIKKIDSQDFEKSVDEFRSLVNENILLHILIEDKKVHHEIKSREELKEKFKWKLNYKLKNELIDKEHEKLFVIALDSLNYHGTDMKTHVKITITELYEYMKTHFIHEEKYMDEINYPLLQEHKILHENIINQMNSFIKKLPSFKIVEFEKKLIEYMDIWLINHILYEDRKIINFAENN